MIANLALPSLRILLAAFPRALADWSYPDCSAPFWRLYWNARGRGIVDLEGRRRILEGRAVFLIPPETPFSTEASSPMDHLYLHILVGPPYDAAMPCVQASRASEAELGELALLAARVGAGDADTAGPLAASICYRRLAAFPRSRLGSGKGGELARRVAQFVLSRPGDPPSNARIAEELGSSVPTLERIIARETGRSLHEYALESRVTEACLMLRHGTDSVEGIAESLGFSDRSHFARAFERFRGLSPSAYRRSRA